MIIEFFGLSGTGKTAVAKETARLLQIEYVNIDTFWERIKYLLLYFLGSPLAALAITARTARDSGLDLKLLRHKLFIFLCMAARDRKARALGRRRDVILDEGMAEHGICLFQRKISPKRARRYFRNNVDSDVLIILKTEEGQRMERVFQKERVPRLGLEKDWDKWQAVQAANAETFQEALAGRQNVIEVDTTSKTIEESAREAARRIERLLGPTFLIFTQKIDRNDTALGFFHEWLKKLAQKFPKITAVCLFKGESDLSPNVKVLSLGKEKKESRFLYVIRFFKYIFGNWNSYETVFVHMNPIYVVLGGIFWRLGGKSVILWYNHPRGNRLAKTAYYLSNRVCYTSDRSFFSGRKKSVMMPAGIDGEIYRRDPAISREKNSILCLGRISPIKNNHVLVEAAKILEQKGLDFKINIYGDADRGEEKYFDGLKQSASEMVAGGRIEFFPGPRGLENARVFNQNEIFVNLTPSGSLDKTVIEAMACECVPVVSNKSFTNIVEGSGFMFKEEDAQSLAEKLVQAIALSPEEKESRGRQAREGALAKHDLETLVGRLKEIACEN